jgi:hypothetical protein
MLVAFSTTDLSKPPSIGSKSFLLPGFLFKTRACDHRVECPWQHIPAKRRAGKDGVDWLRL